MAGKQIYLAKVKSPSQLKAIRMKCIDCCGGVGSEVKDCHIVKCPLWPYRFGANPAAAVTAKEPYYDIVLVDVNKVDYIEQLGK